MLCVLKVNVGTEFPDGGNICGTISPLLVVTLQNLQREFSYEKSGDVILSFNIFIFLGG